MIIKLKTETLHKKWSALFLWFVVISVNNNSLPVISLARRAKKNCVGPKGQSKRHLVRTFQNFATDWANREKNIVFRGDDWFAKIQPKSWPKQGRVHFGSGNIFTLPHWLKVEGWRRAAATECADLHTIDSNCGSMSQLSCPPATDS